MQLSIRHRIVNAASWNLVGVGTRGLLQFVVMVTMARCLSVEQFGVAAIAVSVANFCTLVSDFGITPAIVGQDSLSSEFLDAVFITSLLVGALLYAAVFFSSGFIAEYYQQPQLISLLRVAGLSIFVGILATIPTGLLQRELNFRGLAASQSIAALTSAAGAVYIALTFRSVYALIVPAVMGTAANFVVATRLAKRKIGFHYRPEGFKTLRRSLNFNISSLVSALTNYLSNHGAVVWIMGKIWSPLELGLYSFSYGKFSRYSDLVVPHLTGALFPILKKSQADLDRTTRGFLKLTDLGFWLIVPVQAVLILGMPVIVPAVFGQQWVPAVSPLQVLCLIPVFRSFSIAATPVLYSLNLPHVAATLASVRFVGYAAFIFMAFRQELHMNHVVWIVVAWDSFICLLYSSLSLRYLRSNMLTLLWEMREGFVANALFALALVATVSLLKKTASFTFLLYAFATVVLMTLQLLALFWRWPEVYKLVKERWSA